MCKNKCVRSEMCLTRDLQVFKEAFLTETPQLLKATKRFRSALKKHVFRFPKVFLTWSHTHGLKEWNKSWEKILQPNIFLGVLYHHSPTTTTLGLLRHVFLEHCNLLLEVTKQASICGRRMAWCPKISLFPLKHHEKKRVITHHFKRFLRGNVQQGHMIDGTAPWPTEGM